MNSSFRPIAVVMVVSWMCALGAGASEAATAGAPEKAFLFSYFIGNGEDGLHLAWSRDGYHWERLNSGRSYLRPEVGESKLMRDPCLLRGPDGTFHLVWTTSWKGKTIGYAHSGDLVHWSAQKAIPVMAHEPAALNCWAPEIVWDAQHREFLIFWATTVTNRFRETAGGGDEQYNHRVYATTTTDFTSFTPTRLFYDPGFNVIDATILAAGGRYYLIVKDETRNPAKKHLRLASSDNIGGPYGNLSAPFTRDWVEGPTALRVGDSFLVYFDAYRDHRYEAMRSRDLKVWEDVSGRISMPHDARHGTAIEVPGSVVERLLGLPGGANAAGRINRLAVVTRHNPIIRKLDVDAPLTVGNGGFAFGVDITGLQTFPEYYHRWGVPVETQSRWCWVTDPNPNGYKLADANKDFKQADGRVVGYPTQASTPAGDWLRKNPRLQPLGQISLDFQKADGSVLRPEDIRKPEQTLDLWRGVITSRYEIDGQAVKVTTACHPMMDLVAVRIESDLVASGRLGAKIAFPRGYDLAVKHTPPLDWSKPEAHRTRIAHQTPDWAQLERSIGDTHYETVLAWAGRAQFTNTSPHHFQLAAVKPARVLEFTVGFYPGPALPSAWPSVDTTLKASAAHWEEFWQRGAAVDFSGSTDPRAVEMEKRVVLSRYLMAAQMAGEVPPQESGLTCATWYGKHHTEMIWWHTAHFALWGNDELLAKNLAWYQRQLPLARELASSRGLRGARWAKMTGPDLRESPGGNPLIVWNQPHPVYLCELLYRNSPLPETLSRYRDLVLQTAECLASMVWFDEAKGVYVLGPPLWIAQEIHDPATSQNPSFELAYWGWALETAQVWRERLGLKRDERWDQVLEHLAPLPQKNGKYVALGSHPDTFDNLASRHDHPTMLAPLGLLPGRGVDRATMERTLDAVLKTWDWETKIWGWDYPMIATTAARLGRPETAVEILLRKGPNNIYLPNGHCPQRSDEAAAKAPKPGARKREIAAYLPANGAFLTAVAMMVAGWDGNTNGAPGFPQDGKWKIRHEGLRGLP